MFKQAYKSGKWVSEITVRKRRKKNSLRGWLLCFALTAAFSLMGFSLAAFQSSLYVSGTVGTAEVFVEFENSPRLYEHQFVNREPEKADNQNAENLNFAHDITVVTTETEKEEGVKFPELKAVFSDSEQKSIEVYVSNAYPGDIYRLNYGLKNSGTMPVKITAEIVDNSPRLKIQEPRSGYILNPNDEPFSEDLLITVTDDVSESNDYSFNIQITYKQWNK